MTPKKVYWAFSAQCPLRHTTPNLSLTLALTLIITQNQHMTHPKKFLLPKSVGYAPLS